MEAVYVISILFSFLFTESLSACDKGWIYNSMERSCYEVISGTSKNWKNARDDCLRKGSDLVSVDSAREQAFLQGVLSTCVYGDVQDLFWIGANDQHLEERWEWSNKVPFKYFNWHPDKPVSTVDESCFVIVPQWDYQWSKRKCSDLNNYICEKSASTLSTVSSTHKQLTKITVTNEQSTVTRTTPTVSTSDEGESTTKTTFPVPTAGKSGSCLPFTDEWKMYNKHCYMAQDGKENVGTSFHTGDEWSDGSPLRFINWNTNEPNNANGGEMCASVSVRNGKWNDEHCEKKYGYVCEKSFGTTRPPATQAALMTGYCPKGFSAFESRCFKVYTSAADWAGARRICKGQGRGYDLASIVNVREQAFVTTLLLNSKVNLWLGMYKTQNSKAVNLRWAFNDDPMQYTNWASNEPNGGMKDECIMMYNGQTMTGLWADNNCTTPMGFICETMRKPFISKPETIPNPCNAAQRWTPLGQDCFKLITTPRTWTDASAYCQSVGADLTSIRTAYEQAFVFLLASDNSSTTPVWIGMNDIKTPGKFVWVDKWPVLYTNWRRGEPSWGPNKECVLFDPAQGLWRNGDCAKHLPFVCRISTSTPPITTSSDSTLSADPTKPLHTDNGSLQSTTSPMVTQTTHAGNGTLYLFGSRNASCLYSVPCKAEAMISGTYSLPYGQGALQAASSRNPSHNAEASRLTPLNNASWSAANGHGQWISATFNSIIIIRGLKVEGRRDTNEWISKFKLMYQYDYFSPWYTYQDPPGTDKEFYGNRNSYAPLTVFLQFPVEAKSIKLIPTDWHNGISLRWEIFGCTGEECLAEYGVSGPLFIQDDGFTSSTMLDHQHNPSNSRLHPIAPNSISSCWKPSLADRNAWLEINIGSVKFVRGVTTAGNPNAAEWVTKYQLKYKIADGTNRYNTYQQPYGTDYVFPGNTDTNTFVTNVMKSYIRAQHVRILVESFHTAIALRLDLLVCPLGCKSVPLINGPHRLPDSQLTASSSHDYHHGPQRSRLNQPIKGAFAGGWTALKDDKHQYIQVDLGRIVEVTAVATQGLDGSDQYVRQYTMTTSADGKDWYPYYIGRTVKVFDGNWDSSTVRKHYLIIPMNARFVRLWPTDWHDRISLRWELYGCPGPMSSTTIGCYGDKKTDRDLPFEPLTDPASGMWPPACVHHCYRKGYLYAGLQNGFQCFCGNSYGKYGPSANCSMPCFPHPTMKCGGPSSNIILSTGLFFEKVCKQGWTKYGDDCYLFESLPASWSEGRKQCQSKGGDFVSIGNENQGRFVSSLTAKGNGDVWIGLNDRQITNGFMWSNKRPFEYSNWDTLQPDGHSGKNEHCVIVKLQTGAWGMESCDKKHQYICMAPATSNNQVA